MKKIIIIIGLCLFMTNTSIVAQEITPQVEQRAKEIVSKMTLQEKIEYISGYTSFSLRAIPRLGIPEIKLADGPQGIRNHAPKSTLYPSGILSASTWNRDLLYKLGQGLGQDARARGVNILLGPGVNIYRAPLCGRNYEYMGEDPFLASEAAKHYILGVQSEGVIATIKHFAANNQEWSRHHASSDIDERTLQEVYFPVFRKAVKEANVGAVMNSYNLLNGVHTTEHKWLNIDILRNLWGFKGILMSDWTSVYSAVGAANGGLDLEMPKGRFMNLENLLPAIKNGTVTEETINLKVQHILQTLIAFGMLDKEQKDSRISLDNPFSRQAALELAREGVVLLKNDDDLLPLKGKTAVMGPNADLIPTGGGSGFVTPFSTVSVSQGLKELKNKNLVILTDDVIYEDIIHEFYTDDSRRVKGFKAEYFKNKTLSGRPEVVRTESSIEYDWGYGASLEGFPTDGFSVRWTACYIPQTDGQLKLHIGGDDGYRLYVNDKHITGDWGNHSYSSREVELPVEAGQKYRFRIEFFDNISSAIIRFNAYSLNAGKSG
jgi:beta-glucosidase